ncbi:LysE family translocator [Ruegeria sp. R13_0]|uniref:LysE family translocator n=1 Tax=Ruegeria sp. R13_0 TaxID=2821099 RepID=UPI001ADC8D7E|nr:LysE family translocator [Ruegeria sp. R13_0]MBO9436388.1 LysE family translocator [Ruegeria sp. R13_0]
MDWGLVLLMVAIRASMFLTPGPDSILVVSRAVSQGLRYAIATTLGVVSAGLVFVPAIAFGLDFTNQLSPTIWMGIRAAGALYLIYIGVRLMRAAFQSCRDRKDVDLPTLPIGNEPISVPYLQGLATNLGNPKMIVVLTSFLPQFVSLELGNISVQILILGFFMYLNGFICLIALSMMAVFAQKKLRERNAFGTNLWLPNAVSGGAMLGVGLWMLIAPAKYAMAQISR